MTRRDPDWPLIRRLVRYVDSAPGGGLHRAELAERLGLTAHPGLVREAAFVAYGKRLIDYAGRYIVTPARNNATQATNATEGETR